MGMSFPRLIELKKRRQSHWRVLWVHFLGLAGITAIVMDSGANAVLFAALRAIMVAVVGVSPGLISTFFAENEVLTKFSMICCYKSANFADKISLNVILVRNKLRP